MKDIKILDGTTEDDPMFPRDLRAATLTQPWAGFVAAGIKPLENRDRQIAGPDLFGKRVAIHASKVIDESIYPRIAELASWLRDDILAAPRIERDFGISATHRAWQLSRVTGAIIGVATLKHKFVGWTPAMIDEHRDALRSQLFHIFQGGDHLRWFFGPVVYVLTDIVALRKPVPCRGMLGFWRVPEDKRADVYTQLREVA